MPFSYLTHLECAREGTRYDASVPQRLCECGSPLLARYDLDAARVEWSKDALADEPHTMWRYHVLLPVQSADAVVSLGEGLTPILDLPHYGRAIGVPNLVAKDEGQLPTGSFKARGASAGVSRARELGIDRIAMPTNGNAGAAWSAYAARAGLEMLVVMPKDAPEMTRKECVAAGADLRLVDGLIGDAGAIVARAADRHGYFPVSTLKEPYRLEGKKTMGFEIAEQGGWQLPDVIVYPAGGGVGLIGIAKALRELAALGWISGPMPKMVAVQAAGCAPIVRAFEAGADTAEPWQDAHTVAFGINVASGVGDFLMLEAIRATGGCAVAVRDEEILAELAACARSDGAFFCPEGAATLAAVKQLRANRWLSGDERVLVINTGSPLKYPDAIRADPPLLQIHDDV